MTQSRLPVLFLTMGAIMAPQWASAADDYAISVISQNITGDCATSTYIITSTWLNTVADYPDDGDIVAMIATDEDDRAIASDWSNGFEVGEVTNRPTALGNSNWINPIVPGKDITVELFDLEGPWPLGGHNFQAQYEEIVNRAKPVAFSLTFNPGNCDQLLDVSAVKPKPAKSIPALSPTGLASLTLVLLLAAGWSVRRFT